ncbi:hypothetical protein BH11PLA2_BH11PLA2_12090 [soil metagenome]
MIRTTVLSLVCLALSTLVARADKVEVELKALVDDVAKVLEKQNQKEIRVGSFSGKGGIPSHFGPEIQRVLIAGFAANKIIVNKDALIEVDGDYRPADLDPSEPASTLMFIRINAKLVNTKSGEPLQNVSLTSRAIYGNEALAKAFAPTVSLPADADLSHRNEKIKERIQKPQTHTDVTKVKSGADSPFEVEVLVVPDTKAADPEKGRAVSVKDGCAFVDIKKTEYYRVRVHNNAKFDVAVKLSIDGLDQFIFSDAEFKENGKPKFEYMVIAKGKSAVISGWFINLKQLDGFVITEYAKSAVAELNASQGEIGQISVQFHAAWETDAQKPSDETGKDVATGRGDRMDVNLTPVKRQIGAMRDQVSIRYVK